MLQFVPHSVTSGKAKPCLGPGPHFIWNVDALRRVGGEYVTARAGYLLLAP